MVFGFPNFSNAFGDPHFLIKRCITVNKKKKKTIALYSRPNSLRYYARKNKEKATGLFHVHFMVNDTFHFSTVLDGAHSLVYEPRSRLSKFCIIFYNFSCFLNISLNDPST